MIIGFVTYYLVPLSYYYNQFGWFLFIFDALLIIIIIGLTFISVLIFEYVEKGLLAILMWTCARRDSKLKDLISKNLDSHRKRNSKTSIMFTLALSFLIFSSATFKLLGSLIQAELVVLFGSDLYVYEAAGAGNIFLD